MHVSQHLLFFPQKKPCCLAAQSHLEMTTVCPGWTVVSVFPVLASPWAFSQELSASVIYSQSDLTCNVLENILPAAFHLIIHSLTLHCIELDHCGPFQNIAFMINPVFPFIPDKLFIIKLCLSFCCPPFSLNFVTISCVP